MQQTVFLYSNGGKLYHVQVKYSEIKSDLLYLGNYPEDLTIDNIKSLD